MMMKIITQNKKVYFNYEIISKFEAGLELLGSEIKSIRAGEASINEAFITFKDNEAFIINMHIANYKFATQNNLATDRTRKLLLHRSEIKKILKIKQLEKLSVVPTKLYWKNNFAKLEIALAKGKKNYDKRETIKKRDEERRLKKQLKP
ncbi:SsrA-binding protein SmpB [Spiroplasma endosymbiont of Amphibalanus improvisus]|uniref:SsrA-binding protein SmpB n=1 Tax=Spiroplasma endosymbiont of Amphibalanus improvisus TaxID=3066327 RepID=UPI003CC7AD89